MGQKDWTWQGTGHGRGTRRGIGAGHLDETLWKKDSCLVCFAYHLTPGPTVHLPDGSTALDLFCNFFTPEVWDLLVNETNRYANTNLSSKPKACHWFDVSLPEIYKSFHWNDNINGNSKLTST